MKTIHNSFSFLYASRLLLVIALFTAASLSLSAAEITVKVVVSGVEASKGQVYFAAFNNEKDYKKNVSFKADATPSAPGSVECEFVLPEGEYVFSIYQDLNANGKLDTNLIGMPKEPVGISGYSGSGIPGGFNTLKMKVDAGTKSVAVNLKKL